MAGTACKAAAGFVFFYSGRPKIDSKNTFRFTGLNKTISCNLVRAPFLNLSALNKNESRGNFTGSIHECQFPRADAGAHAGGGG